MTNGEKFKEVFGFNIREPEYECIGAEKDCKQRNQKFFDEGGIHPCVGCPYKNWVDREYKE